MADADSNEAQNYERDARLLDELRQVVELVDPVPERVLSAAHGSYVWRTIDAELADLAYDSANDPETALLIRSSDAARLLTFESPTLSVEVEVTALAPERRLVGQLVPAQPAEILVRHQGGVLTADADELGRFAVDGVTHGPVSLVCRVGDAAEPRTIATDWLVV